MTAAPIARLWAWSRPATQPDDPRRARVRGRAVRLLTRRMADRAGVRITLPDGSGMGPDCGDAPHLLVRDERIFDRIGIDFKIGVGEGFVAGEWGPGPGTDLADLLARFAANLGDLVPPVLTRFRRLVEPRQPERHRNDRAGARANISHHYDLSNDAFAVFLDETMTYSAAWFAPEDPAGPAGLATAQRRKVAGILDLANVGAGTEVLEIGSGWGQLAIQAAERGALVHTITLSHEQQSLARERIAAAGFADVVDVELRDYRDIAGRYDAVVSVEMIEAVGYEFWPRYFRSLADAVRPDGQVAIQAITMAHSRMLDSRHAYGWIHKHVFPGGLIPSYAVIAHHASSAGLRVTARRSLRDDYARTLREWRKALLDNPGAVRAAGLDDRFLKVWEFYLAYSEAGFRSGHLDVLQLRLTPRTADG